MGSIRAHSLLLMLLVLISGAAPAQSLYRYRDAQGNWVYMDRKPDTVQETRVEQLPIVSEEATPPEIIRVPVAEPSMTESSWSLTTPVSVLPRSPCG